MVLSPYVRPFILTILNVRFNCVAENRMATSGFGGKSYVQIEEKNKAKSFF